MPDYKKSHPWVPFSRHIAQNVDSLKAEVKRRDAAQAQMNAMQDEQDSVKAVVQKESTKGKKLKEYLRDGGRKN